MTDGSVFISLPHFWLKYQQQKRNKDVHGTNRSPEKIVQINKHIWLYHIYDLLFENCRVLIWTNLIPLPPKMLSAKIGWNWLSGSWEEEFLISSMYFRYVLIIYSWKQAGPFIWTNLNPLHPRILCAKFGWNWPSGSGEEDENVKSFQTDRQTDGRTDRRTDRQPTDDRWSEKLTWAFSSGELKMFEKHKWVYLDLWT